MIDSVNSSNNNSAFIQDDLVLDPKNTRFSRSPRNQLIITLNGTEYTDLNVRRAFPLEDAQRYIGFFLADGTELGLLKNLDDLDPDSRQYLMEELEKDYFRPVILEIPKIEEDFGVVHIDIVTSNGPRHIQIRGIRSNIRMLARNRALIEDVDGNRYELRDWNLLPKLTREILGL